MYDLSFTLQSYISFLNYFSFALNLSFWYKNNSEHYSGLKSILSNLDGWITL